MQTLQVSVSAMGVVCFPLEVPNREGVAAEITNSA